jgi:hypothetical protein
MIGHTRADRTGNAGATDPRLRRIRIERSAAPQGFQFSPRWAARALTSCPTGVPEDSVPLKLGRSLDLKTRALQREAAVDQLNDRNPLYTRMGTTAVRDM